MTEFGRTPQISLAEWDELGYELVIFPVSAFRVAVARRGALLRLARGARARSEAFLPQMMTRAELYDRIGYYDYEALDDADRPHRPPELTDADPKPRRLARDGHARRQRQPPHPRHRRVRLEPPLRAHPGRGPRSASSS